MCGLHPNLISLPEIRWAEHVRADTCRAIGMLLYAPIEKSRSLRAAEAIIQDAETASLTARLWRRILGMKTIASLEDDMAQINNSIKVHYRRLSSSRENTKAKQKSAAEKERNLKLKRWRRGRDLNP